MRRIFISTGAGLVIGATMASVMWYRWIESQSFLGDIYETINLPGWWLLTCWLRIGLPRPSGEWGWCALVPWSVIVQWLIIGAIFGGVWNWIITRRGKP